MSSSDNKKRSVLITGGCGMIGSNLAKRLSRDGLSVSVADDLWRGRQLELGYLEKETGIPCCTLLLHNAYGTPTDYGERSQVIPALIRKAVRFPDEEYVVMGNGEQERAFIHVDDVVDAFVLALEKGWGKGCIQIGPSKCTSIREVVETIIGISGKKIEPLFDCSKPEGNKARCADYSKAREILGWEPKVGLEEGLSRCYKWIEKSIENADKENGE